MLKEKEKEEIPEILFYALAKPRVEKGAQYFDTIQPGWEDSIDDGLDMFVKALDVVGQVFGVKSENYEYELMCSKIGIDASNDVALGMQCDPEELNHSYKYIAYYFNALTLLWKLEALKRRLQKQNLLPNS